MEKNYYLAVVFIDLPQVFDFLNHNILLNNLIFRNSGRSVKTFHKLYDKQDQAVLCNSSTSSSKPIKTGVPQCSILGPVLFLVYVNYICNASTKLKFTVYVNDICNASIKFKFTVYADDASLLMADESINSLRTSLERESSLVNNCIKGDKLT